MDCTSHTKVFWLPHRLQGLLLSQQNRLVDGRNGHPAACGVANPQAGITGIFAWCTINHPPCPCNSRHFDQARPSTGESPRGTAWIGQSESNCTVHGGNLLCDAEIYRQFRLGNLRPHRQPPTQRRLMTYGSRLSADSNLAARGIFGCICLRRCSSQYSNWLITPKTIRSRPFGREQ